MWKLLHKFVGIFTFDGLTIDIKAGSTAGLALVNANRSTLIDQGGGGGGGGVVGRGFSVWL